ncbi:hypothetical protein V6N13_124145 [Hibiscus sabdariffa]
MEGVWRSLRQEDVSDSLVLKMREMKMVLKDWNRESFGNVNEKYRSIVAEIEELDTRLNNGELGSSELKRKRELYSQLWAVARLRESVWRQKSRAVWLAEGDRNTNFFHRQARIRMVRNGIRGIQYNGRWETEPERVKFLFAREFRKHFSWVIEDGRLDLNVAFSVLSLDQRLGLEQEFSEAKVKAAIWSCIFPGQMAYVFCMASINGSTRR